MHARSGVPRFDGGLVSIGVTTPSRAYTARLQSLSGVGASRAEELTLRKRAGTILRRVAYGLDDPVGSHDAPTCLRSMTPCRASSPIQSSLRPRADSPTRWASGFANIRRLLAQLMRRSAYGRSLSCLPTLLRSAQMSLRASADQPTDPRRSAYANPLQPYEKQSKSTPAYNKHIPFRIRLGILLLNLHNRTKFSRSLDSEGGSGNVGATVNAA